MKIEINDNIIELDENGVIKTRINEAGGQVRNGAWPKIVDEFYPVCGDTVQTQVDSLIVQPHTFKRRTFDYKSEEYLKKETQENNRAAYGIAKDFNTCESTIRSYRDKYNIKRPLKSKEYLEELWNKHKSVKKIAEETDSEVYEVKIALERKNIINPYEDNKVHS